MCFPVTIEGGDFSFNAGTGNLGNYYMVINAGTSNDGGFILQRDNTNQWQIVNGTTDGDLLFYSYSTSSTVLYIDRSTGNLGLGSLGSDSQHRLKLTAGTGGARCLNMGVGNGGLCATTNNTSGTGSYDAFAFTIF